MLCVTSLQNEKFEGWQRALTGGTPAQQLGGPRSNPSTTKIENENLFF
jgi:hypothetical protein